MTTQEKIQRSMTIEDIFTKYPQKAQKLAIAITKAGLHCVGCSASSFETLEEGMRGHGMSEEQITSLVNTLNIILAEQSDATTITLTPKAAERFQAIAKDQGKMGWAMRLDEVRAGCSGFEYKLDFSEKETPDDIAFTAHGVSLHVAKQKLDRLLGIEIDFVDGLEPGFKISNPNVRSSCGCGTSHNY